MCDHFKVELKPTTSFDTILAWQMVSHSALLDILRLEVAWH